MKEVILVVCIILLYRPIYGGDARNMGFREIMGSTRLESLKGLISFQKGDHLLKKQCELELSLLYPPISCLRRIDQLRVHYRKAHLFFDERAKYDKLCVRRSRQMRDVRWIQRAIVQKPGKLCEEVLIHQKEILNYKNSGLEWER